MMSGISLEAVAISATDEFQAFLEHEPLSLRQLVQSASHAALPAEGTRTSPPSQYSSPICPCGIKRPQGHLICLCCVAAHGGSAL